MTKYTLPIDHLAPNNSCQGDCQPTLHVLPEGYILGGAYRIDRLFVQQSMSYIYLAHTMKTGRSVVVKQPRCAFNFDQLCISHLSLALEGSMLRLLSRARLAVPRYIAEVWEPTGHFLIMSEIVGETLQTLINTAALPPKLAIRIAVQICDILQQAHLTGIVHHDIKPSNIIVNPQGQAVLIDWGAARLIYPQTMRRHVIFTPGFACIEQMQGLCLPSNDVFGLGATLQRSIPYPSQRLRKILRAAEDLRYRSIHEFREDLVALMIQKDELC